MPAPVRILRRSEIAALMTPAAYLDAVEIAFRSYATGNATVPAPMHIAARDGGFHVKGASVTLDRPYVAVKLNGNFPANRERIGLPTIQGALLLCDGSNGSVLAVMDSIEITSRRTAAATALAARYLARDDARSIAICGCGDQGRAQLTALAAILPLRCAKVWDIDFGCAHQFARDMRQSLEFEIIAVAALPDATRDSDIVVTATPAKSAFLRRDCVSPGTFIAAVGADSPHKSEVAAELMAASKIVVDVLSQAAVMGDLRHAIDAGLMTEADVHAALCDVVVGRKSGRTNRHEITLFDSTGVAIEDAASAARIYERAIAQDVGTCIPLASL